MRLSKLWEHTGNEDGLVIDNQIGSINKVVVIMISKLF